MTTTATRAWTTIDKTGWGPGPWHDEPDKLSWTDEATGLPCLIVRNASGALCGYVGVAPDHPWHRVGYNDHAGPTPDCRHTWCDHTPDSRVEIHGGLTYAAGCQTAADEATGICHIPEPGATDDVWWFGFDCAHAFDLTPGTQALMRGFVEGYGNRDDIYRDVDYVRSQATSLAAQLQEVAA